MNFYWRMTLALALIWLQACRFDTSGVTSGAPAGEDSGAMNTDGVIVGGDANNALFCGDKICSAGENRNNCPKDCKVKCGDSICSAAEGETVATCPGDCKPSCGDGVCSKTGGENAGSCPKDCKEECGDGICSPGEKAAKSCVGDCPASCGNHTCDSNENAANCPGDCKAKCPDGFCTHGENAKTCPGDCPPKCPDGFCTSPENASTCSQDCLAKCPDGFCTHGENAKTCPGDCLVSCGDNLCTHNETAQSCPGDCKAVCPDGACTHSETPTSCPLDCQTLLKLTPDVDTLLNQYSSSKNYSGYQEVRAGSGIGFNAATRTLLWWNISKAPGCNVQSAKLHLYLFKDADATSPTLDIHAIKVSWSSSEVSWKKRFSSTGWSQPGGDFESAVEASLKITPYSYKYVSWDITSLVKKWYQGIMSNHGLIILEKDDGKNTKGRKYFRSRNYSSAAHHPYLEISCAL